MIRLVLPLPPSTNRYSRTGRGRHYTPAEVLAFRRDVAESIRQQLPGHQMIRHGVRVGVDVFMPRRGMDLDNRDSKVLFDSLTRCGFWEDDKQLCGRLEGGRYLDPDNPRVELRIVPECDARRLDAWKQGAGSPALGLAA